jgi:Carboxypeptidase regulatory-like domain
MTRMEKSLIPLLLFVLAGAHVCGQQLIAPAPQPAHIAGTVTDTNGDLIPGATILVQGPSQHSQTAVANDNGSFQLDNLTPGTPYEVTVSAQGFVDWKLASVVLSPGQFDLLNDIKLTMLGEAASVTVSASEVPPAVEQVKLEEQQRVLGFIPNFYVTYDKNAAPLTSKLKFELALKVSIDPVTFAGTSFLAAMNQADHYPNYVEGMKGYGQRFGAVYTNDLTDIMIGGAILPSLLHQDPRYFYQGTGTKKSRLFHALSSPVICKGDNGRWQPNYSSLGGYLASGAIANAYYPQSNRGAGLVFNTFAIDFSANIANGVLQEFVLRKLTPNAKNRN